MENFVCWLSIQTIIFTRGKRMFRKNTSYLQASLFGIASQLPAAKLKKLTRSKGYYLLSEVKNTGPINNQQNNSFLLPIDIQR